LAIAKNRRKAQPLIAQGINLAIKRAEDNIINKNIVINLSYINLPMTLQFKELIRTSILIIADNNGCRGSTLYQDNGLPFPGSDVDIAPSLMSSDYTNTLNSEHEGAQFTKFSDLTLSPNCKYK
jgi:hypothetical protein